jgi:hypothetical protein
MAPVMKGAHNKVKTAENLNSTSGNNTGQYINSLHYREIIIPIGQTISIV